MGIISKAVDATKVLKPGMLGAAMLSAAACSGDNRPNELKEEDLRRDMHMEVPYTHVQTSIHTKRIEVAGGDVYIQAGRDASPDSNPNIVRPANRIRVSTGPSLKGLGNNTADPKNNQGSQRPIYYTSPPERIIITGEDDKSNEGHIELINSGYQKVRLDLGDQDGDRYDVIAPAGVSSGLEITNIKDEARNDALTKDEVHITIPKAEYNQTTLELFLNLNPANVDIYINGEPLDMPAGNEVYQAEKSFTVKPRIPIEE